MKQRLFTRNFAFLISGQISSLMGNYALKFALSMYVLEQTGSAGIFAGLLALSMLPTILLSPLGGILADRANRRNIMVGLDLLSGLFVLAAGLILSSGLLPSSGGDLSLIGALLIILSVLAAFESPTVQACVPQMLSGDNLLKGNALVSQVSAVSGLIAPFLGSLLYSAVGILPVLWAAAACFFLTALLECFIRLNYQNPQKAPGLLSVIREDFSDSMRFLRRKEPDILKLLLLAALVSLFVAGTTVVGFPYLVRTVLGLSPEYYGAAESAMGLSAILGTLSVALLAGKLLPRHLALVFVSFGLCLIPYGLAFLLPLGTLSRYFVLLIMFCASQLGCCIFSTYAITLVQGRTPQQLMGKVMAYVYTLSMCAQPLGQLMYGALFDLFSASPYWILIPSGLVVSAIGLASVRFFRRLEG